MDETPFESADRLLRNAIEALRECVSASALGSYDAAKCESALNQVEAVYRDFAAVLVIPVEQTDGV